MCNDNILTIVVVALALAQLASLVVIARLWLLRRRDAELVSRSTALNSRCSRPTPRTLVNAARSRRIAREGARQSRTTAPSLTPSLLHRQCPRSTSTLRRRSCSRRAPPRPFARKPPWAIAATPTPSRRSSDQHFSTSTRTPRHRWPRAAATRRRQPLRRRAASRRRQWQQGIDASSSALGQARSQWRRRRRRRWWRRRFARARRSRRRHQVQVVRLGGLASWRLVGRSRAQHRRDANEVRSTTQRWRQAAVRRAHLRNAGNGRR